MGPPGEGWVGRRVVVHGPGARMWHGMVHECLVGSDGALNRLTIQPPTGGAPVYVPANSIDGVQPDGWSEALSQANMDFQLGEGRRP